MLCNDGQIKNTITRTRNRMENPQFRYRNMLDWSVCTCLTKLYDGRDMYRIYYIKYNYMFRHLILDIFSLRNEKNLVSSCTRLTKFFFSFLHLSTWRWPMPSAETCSCSLCNKFYTYLCYHIVVLDKYIQFNVFHLRTQRGWRTLWSEYAIRSIVPVDIEHIGLWQTWSV